MAEDGSGTSGRTDSTVTAVTTVPASTTSIIGDKNGSFSMDYDLIGCEICFEPFHPAKRPPKLLPCGHNFCEQCIFSLCCHQQYYLLDSINCPTCRTELSTSTAFAAPTNYDLCKMLETVLPQLGSSNSANVTVIHVPDISSGSNGTEKSSRIGRRSWHRRFAGRYTSSNRLRSMCCANCSRKLNETKRRKEARFCVRCFGSEKDGDDCLRLACLECCVNRHNGHQLVTLNELECEHQKLINDLHTLEENIRETSVRIEENLRILKEDLMMPAADCKTLCKAKQSLRRDCEADLKFALSVLENAGTVPLSPAVLHRMRQHQYQNGAKLHKLLHFIEKCNESINDRYNRHIKLKTSVQVSSPFSLTAASMRQSRTALNSNTHDNRSATEAVAAVLAVACSSSAGFGNRTQLIEEAVKVLSKKGATKSQKRTALLCCAKQLHLFIEETTSKQSLLLYIDAYLHIFYQLNLLVTRFPSDDDGEITVTRRDVWKLVQLVYTDLMRCAAKQWRSEEGDRVDLVDDLAFLCSLYSDVCDQATITICMIEAARARAAASLPKNDDEWRTMQIRLNLIDEHLMECRRVQKLHQLRVATASRPRRCRYRRWQLMKRLWKLVWACFNKSTEQ